tara:strand:- start:2056 stop:2262 length:207 start_codon:yes stop_codon:yes gene_type:complete
MDDMIYISGSQVANYQQFKPDGSATDFMDGYMIEIFIPEGRADDVDRNDTNRRQVTAKIEEAIAELGG